MKYIIEMDDDVAVRVCPCDKKGKHDHAKCTAEFIENGLIGGTFRRELEEAQAEFQKAYKRPTVTVTAE